MRVVALADLHVGSLAAVADPDMCGGHEVCGQLYEHYAASATGKWAKPDVLLCLAEAVEGQNRRQGGIGTWTTDLVEQAQHAAELLNMWRAKAVIIIRGSPYHVEPNGSGLPVEEFMARQVKGAVKYPQKRGRCEAFSGRQWYTTFNGWTMHLQHKMPVSRVWHYRSTPLAREMLYTRLGDALKDAIGQSRTAITLRAHVHTYLHVEYSTTHGWSLPCWKAYDDYMEEAGALAITPDIGFVGFEFSDRGGMTYEKHLWKVVEVQPPAHTRFGGRR